MSCNPKHVTYQTERRQKSPQLPLPPGPPAKVPLPAKVAELLGPPEIDPAFWPALEKQVWGRLLEEPHVHIGDAKYSFGFDAGKPGGDYSAVTIIDSSGRVRVQETWPE